MYNEKGNQHKKPHIHAEYQGEEIVIALDGEILESKGNMPKNKMKLIDAWMGNTQRRFGSKLEASLRRSGLFQNCSLAVKESQKCYNQK